MPKPTPEQEMQIAVGLHQSGRLEQAELIYKNILAGQPNYPDALHLLGVIAGQRGRHEEAVEIIGRAIAAAPDRAEYHCNLALILQNRGEFDKAVESYHRALAIRPNYPEVHLNLGVGWKNKGDVDQAIACYQRALELKSDYPAAHNNLGNGWKDKGEWERAIKCYQKALELNPNYPEALLNLGIAYEGTEKFDDAIESYQKLLKIRPNTPGAYNNMGIALWKKGDADQAIKAYQKALELRPNFAEAHYNMGIVWKGKGLLDEAIAAYQRALEIKPDYLDALSNLGSAWGDAGRLDLAIKYYRKAMEVNPGFIVADNNLLYTLPFDPGTSLENLWGEYQRWNRLHAAPLKGEIKRHENERVEGRRLRVGYVSADFINHPVGRFLLPLLEKHDREAFEIFCYSDVAGEDEITAKLKGHADVWRRIVGMTDQQVAEKVREDQIDILVDLTMHMANNRLLVFARKPAPVQVTYLAYAGGTAVDAIDYRLTDWHLDPNEADDRFYMEKSIRLEGTYWCYQPGEEAPDVGELPSIKEGRITFGCLNNFCKVNQNVIETWAKLLLQVKDARLLMYSHEGSHRETFLRKMEERGIARGRIELVGRTSLAEYFKRYQKIDIALDPFPYTGGTTTCDSLWMGVPVVTLAGRAGMGRSGVSVLNNAGMAEMIAETTEEYVRIASNLAGDLARLGELRSTLRERMRNSRLMDAEQFTRAVESAYKTMWQNWVSQAVQ